MLFISGAGVARGSVPGRGRRFSSNLYVQTKIPVQWDRFPGGKVRPGRDADYSPPI
jgi:hypothetical protein